MKKWRRLFQAVLFLMATALIGCVSSIERPVSDETVDLREEGEAIILSTDQELAPRSAGKSSPKR